MSTPKIIALFPNEKKQDSFALAIQIKEFFEKQGVTVAAEDEKASQIGAKPLSDVSIKDVQFLIAMGGDGTLLRIAHAYGHFEIPVLGINLGHLGFMADIPLSEVFPSLTDLLEGAYTIDQRLVLEATSHDGSPLLSFNDIVFHRASNYSLIELAVHIDGTYVNTFVADGMIIATPTGSTAYSLSSGGPILFPSLKAIVMTPICPHTISNRPIVLSSSHTIEVKYLSDYAPIEVRSDGLNAFFLPPKKSVKIRKSERTFKLVNLHRHEYFSTLRKKLHWSGKLTGSP